jgi:putative DNA primase/helicase
MTNYIDEELKQQFRDSNCVIVAVAADKRILIPYGTELLTITQSDEEFEKLLPVENWAVIGTNQSNILLFDLDKNDYDQKLNRFFNRSRRSFKKGEFIFSQHGFIKVTDADHSWCKEFEKKYHNKVGIEIYADNHWVIFAGTYNSKKIKELVKDENGKLEEMPKSTWSYTDDLRAKPILEFTKQELGDIFGQIPIIKTGSTTPHSDLSISEIRKENFVVHEGEDREVYLLKDLVARIDANKDIANKPAILLAYAHTYNTDHCVPPLESKRVDKMIKQSIKYSSGHEETRGRKKKKLEKNTTDGNSKFALDIDHLLDDNGYFSYTEFAELIISKYHFKSFTDSKEILYYEDNGYKFEGDVVIQQLCEYTIDEVTDGMVSEIQNKVRRRTFVKRDDFDNFKDGFLNFNNCRLNPETNEQKEYNHEDLILTKLPINYNPKSKCPKIMKFLKECLPNSHDRHSVLEHLSSCLLLELKLEKAVMYLGGGGNGKGTWFNVIDKFLGNENISNLSIDEMINDRFKVADLFGKILNMYAEIGKKTIKELARFKLIVSGDTITVEHKGGKPFKIKPRARHLFSLNKLPELDEETDAVFRRFDLIRWNQKFIDTKDNENDDETTNKADLDLEYTLVTDDELSGLLNIILKIRRDLKNRKRFLYSKSIEEMRNIWKSESDSVTKFAKNCLEVSDGWIMLRTDLYRHYRTFCKEYLKEEFETEQDFMLKIQKSIFCQFKRYRFIQKDQTKFQCVLGVKFKDSMGIIAGYSKGMKQKTAPSDLGTLFDK